MFVIPYIAKVRDPATGKWHHTRYRMTEEDARERFGEGNYELREWSNGPGKWMSRLGSVLALLSRRG